ncbi:MAG: hypothetical protein V2I63_03050 [Pseudomonadales bacterium]|nr:hypothetical protein [Pseudomonadales bacterium]
MTSTRSRSLRCATLSVLLLSPALPVFAEDPARSGHSADPAR